MSAVRMLDKDFTQGSLLALQVLRLGSEISTHMTRTSADESFRSELKSCQSKVHGKTKRLSYPIPPCI